MRRILAVAGLAALSACQAAGPGGVLAVDEAATASAPAPSVQTHGAGPTRVALVLSSPAAGGGPVIIANDIRDGALLALDDLGEGKLTLAVFQGAKTTGEVEAQVRAASTDGARLIIGPVGREHARAAAAIDAASRPALLTLAHNGSIDAPLAWTLYPDAIDSALEGARVAIAARQSNFVILHPVDEPAADLARLQRGIAGLSGKVLGQIGYPAGGAAAISDALVRHQSAFAKAQAVIVLGDSATAGVVIDALAAGTPGNTIATAIGTTYLPSALYSRPAAQGLIIARPAAFAASLIQSRFEARFHRPPSQDAAVGYDTVAVAAGLLRTGGGGAVTPAALQSAKGFRALTGLFRFRADGTIERRHVVYRIENGSLVPLQEEGAGF